MLDLPPGFISTLQTTFQEDGQAFLQELPASIARVSAQWGLTDIRPVSNLSYNYVAFAARGAEQVVLKMGVPRSELRSEMAALRLFDGEGACRLLAYEEEKCWMLLERLQPGAMLSTLQDDEEATRIAAAVMQKIWKPVPAEGEFIQLSDWFDGLKRLRDLFDGGTGPFPPGLVNRVERAVQDFFEENHQPVLLHGDFHHFNILSSERGWSIIDPKGVIGPAAYETGPFLINPWDHLSKENDYRRITKRRIDILHEQLGLGRERIREWGLAHAILSAWWGMEDETGWEYALSFAEMIAGLDL